MEYVRIVRKGEKNTRVLLASGETKLVANRLLGTVWVKAANTVSPALTAVTFGCEFEFILPTAKREELGRALAHRLGARFGGITCQHHVTRYATWQWGTDGSITAPYGYTGIEIKTPILTFSDESAREIKDVLKIIEDLGGKVNRSTGTHAHLAFRQHVSEIVRRKLFDTYGAWEEIFFDRIVAPSRRNNRYCKSCRDHEYGDRYHKLNVTALDRYGTLEFRQHQGTLSGNKILSWVSVCRAWAEAVTSKAFPHPFNFENAIEVLELSPALTQWVRSRYEDFNE